jgi:hypothetical protein
VFFGSFLERLTKFVEASLPECSVTGDPGVEFAERFRTKRIKALLPVSADANETLFVQDAEMSRNSGLVDADSIDNSIDRIFTAPKRLDDAKARGIGQSLKDGRIHGRVYSHTCIFVCQALKKPFQQIAKSSGDGEPGTFELKVMRGRSSSSGCHETACSPV